MLPEDVLNGKIIQSGGGNEIKQINEYFVDLPTYTNVRKRTYDSNSRKDDIRFVLGPSGSGKTFFSVRVAAVQDLSNENKYVIVYIKVTKLSEVNALVSTELVNHVKQLLLAETWFDKKLELNLSIIIDEAGSTEFNGSFDSVEYVAKIYSGLLQLATNVRLVLCGTGLSGTKHSTDGQAIKYRMKGWSMDDIKEVNNKHLKLHSSTIEAIQQHPTLNALTTNARAAWFMLVEIQRVIRVDMKTWSNGNIHSRIQQQVINFAPAIVRGVVSSYILANGIQDLNETQQHLVAAYVFDATEKARNKKLDNPDFSDLKVSEQNVAFSLVSLNIERYSNGTVNIVDNQEISVSVSPALSLVLYWMCGVSVEMLSDWKMQEVLSQLYQLRRMMRDCINSRALGKLSYDQLGVNLTLLRIIRLNRRVPEPKSKNSFAIPFVDTNTVWMNKDLAPFADVVAPYSLYQSKYSQSKSPTLNLTNELSKCGLLRDEYSNNQVGWVITKSLELVWMLNIEREEEVADFASTYNTNKTSTYFYPEVQFAGSLSGSGEKYAELRNISGSWILNDPEGNEHPVDVNLQLSKELIFFISSNQNQIKLSRKEKLPHNKSHTQHLTISRNYLDDDGNVKEDLLLSLDCVEWNYYKALLRPNVKIRFLLG